MRWVWLVLLGLSAPASARAWPAPFERLDGDTLRVELELVRGWNLFSDELLLGRPLPPQPAAGGGAWLLDLQLAELWWLPEVGPPEGPLGRRGEGPGEWGMPAALALGPAGEPWVLSAVPPRIVAPRGEDPALPAPLRTASGRLPLELAWSGGHGALRWQGLLRGGDGLQREWGLLRWNRTRVDTVSVRRAPYRPGRVEPAGADDGAPWALLPGGAVVEAPDWGEYRLWRHGPAGEVLERRREQAPVPWAPGAGVELPPGVELVAPPQARVVQGLRAAGPWLLVRTARGGATAFDIFGPGLDWRGHLQLELPAGLGADPQLVPAPDGWWLLDPEGVGRGPLVAKLR